MKISRQAHDLIVCCLSDRSFGILLERQPKYIPNLTDDRRICPAIDYPYEDFQNGHTGLRHANLIDHDSQLAWLEKVECSSTEEADTYSEKFYLEFAVLRGPQIRYEDGKGFSVSTQRLALCRRRMWRMKSAIRQRPGIAD